MSYQPKSALGRAVNQVEETFIAIALGLMTLVAFANVVARYVFNDNILWALETTVYLFAWLVLIGTSYCVKVGAHLGVDVLLNIVSKPVRRTLSFLAIIACVAFAALLLKGSWDYWWLFANKRSFLEVNDVPMPGFLQFFSVWLNEGEAYEKMPRFIPYFALPLGMALLLFRSLQAGWELMKGERDMLIASHEAEDMTEELSAELAEDEKKAGGN
ncbi:TRAP transporter small permease [Limibacillus halophilus]|jgi:C4-dicarboxylate transporter DctQ subunit